MVAEKKFLSPKGRKYRILTTNERDPYESQATNGKRSR